MLSKDQEKRKESTVTNQFVRYSKGYFQFSLFNPHPHRTFPIRLSPSLSPSGIPFKYTEQYLIFKYKIKTKAYVTFLPSF